MPRRPRLDPPGSWHHVVNRGIAKRPLFEHRDDVRYFLSRLAWQVKAGRVEIHAFSILQTHYHLLIRSPGGGLSEAMRRIQNAYVRRFNRQRRRDGSLARGRFFSRVVDTDAYLHALVRYIDFNAVRAGLARVPEDHEHGSARHYLLGTRPPWLDRSWLEPQACRLAGVARFDASAYREAFGRVDEEGRGALAELVESRMSAADREGIGEEMLAAALGGARSWMRWKTALADGVPLGQPICGPRALLVAIANDEARNGNWFVPEGRRIWRGSEVARVGMLHALCCLSDLRLAEREGGSTDRIRRIRSAHRRLMSQDPEYARRAMDIGRAAVIAAWPTSDTPRVRHSHRAKKPQRA